jgi:NAD(P)H-dependent FMN reductase
VEHDERLRVAVIIGSTRVGRFGGVVGRWIAGLVDARSDMDLDLVDLLDVPLDPALGAGPPDVVVAYRECLAAADGFVVVTPEYNHSFPAVLKQAIDVGRSEWMAKPVGFVAYGGLSGGLRAVEHLRGVFAELHAVTLRDTVSFHGAHARFDDGRPVDEVIVEGAAKVLLDQLAWWGLTLREGRARRPYAA